MLTATRARAGMGVMREPWARRHALETVARNTVHELAAVLHGPCVSELVARDNRRAVHIFARSRINRRYLLIIAKRDCILARNFVCFTSLTEKATSLPLSLC